MLRMLWLEKVFLKKKWSKNLKIFSTNGMTKLKLTWMILRLKRKRIRTAARKLNLTTGSRKCASSLVSLSSLNQRIAVPSMMFLTKHLAATAVILVSLKRSFT